ncbi:alpha-1,4-N-acetylgalactosamine transferase PglH [Nonlabens ulvanivorans]|uniref:Alpha-1,4-N-acetylgalactosamine transferase PglH n=1 Tax=Nonlabens ulvanivorans TaxID=906888 RepID=A0A090WFP4_NONUL|nr:glycosyltransferase [Nonlabens ulvanivorans]GAL74998.1 alpha-1,4-N-acetylgalactosamine transferase PglH [Nonlabens ulvanivorans]
MRIIQIIDSLDAGGAERMAVQIANELQIAGHESHICVTRREGLLKKTINDEVGYLFIEKKGKLGIKAMTKLKTYIVKNNIDTVHTHSTSFFTATIIKWWIPSVKLIWHDHYGNAEDLDNRKVGVLRKSSRFFDGIISVNQILKDWSIRNLKPSNVIYLRNFVSNSLEQQLLKPLPGSSGKRIVHLANLRPQKDHIVLIKAFQEVTKNTTGWNLLLVGMDFQDDYARNIKSTIEDLKLDEHIHLLGSREDTIAILKACDLGVLSSKSEGLPVAILEYGLAGLPVVTTDVGACKEVVLGYGKVVPSQDINSLSQAIQEFIDNPEEAKSMAHSYQQHVMTTFGAASYIEKLETFYSSL